MIVSLISLCVPIVAYFFLFSKKLFKNKEFLYVVAWIFCGASIFANNFLPNLFKPKYYMGIFAFSVGFMTVGSALYFISIRPLAKEVSKKRKSALMKMPILGAFIFLTVMNEFGFNILGWLHWGAHLLVLLMVFLSRDIKSFYMYSISTVFVTIYYLFENELKAYNLEVILLSLVSLSVLLTFKLAKKYYVKNNTEIIN